MTYDWFPDLFRVTSDDLYYNSEAYLALDRDVKMSELWAQLTVEPTVKCQQFGDMADLFSQSPRYSYTTEGDELPANRSKLVHQQGIVAKAEFIAEPNSYTGVFQGSDSVIIRMSESGLHVDDITHTVNPSIALKFLRDGTTSANQFGMITFEEAVGVQTWDWFAKDLFSHVETFESHDDEIEDPTECVPKTVARFFATTT